MVKRNTQRMIEVIGGVEVEAVVATVIDDIIVTEIESAVPTCHGMIVGKSRNDVTMIVEIVDGTIIVELIGLNRPRQMNVWRWNFLVLAILALTLINMRIYLLRLRAIKFHHTLLR